MITAIEKRVAGRLYAYVRVSTDKQSLGPEAQRQIIDAFTVRLGLSVDAYFEDAPVFRDGGMVDDSACGAVPLGRRRAGGEMMARLTRGDVVIVAKVDRAFRSLADCAACLDRWETMGVGIVICDLAGQLDIGSPFGKAMVQILAVFAELERKMISQRTREALALRKRQGTANSRYPGYGFRWERRWDREKLKHVKHKVADPEERRVMKEIVRWRLDGLRWEEITERIVYELELVTKDGKPWNQARIMRAFQAELQLQAREN